MISVRACSPSLGFREGLPLEQIPALLSAPDEIVWVDMISPGEEGERLLRDVFHFHPLAVEDCLVERHHPKVEAYEGYTFLISHGVVPETTALDFQTREMDAFVAPRLLVTHHSYESRSTWAVVQQIQKNPADMARGVDYILYRILDAQVDMWVDVLDVFDERIDALEERIFVEQGQPVLDEIFSIRRSVMRLRRIATHQRETLLRLSRGEFPQIRGDAAFYLRDVYDHLVRVTDLAELYRELISGILEAYLSVVSNRLNDVMKVLTVFATIFIPMTFITSVYGMNFAHMPELGWRWSYPILWCFMIAAAAGILYAFHRRKYI